MTLHRRRLLAAIAGVTTVGLGGCLDGISGSSGETEPTPTPGNGSQSIETTRLHDDGTFDCDDLPSPQPTAEGPPVDEVDRPLPGCPDELMEASLTGARKDGIPAIDDPVFEDADTADGELDDGEPVFGLVHNGEARAYPQRILVWHEIVNDTVDGDRLSVTYCPLTGTTQGFYRGETTFGVSGKLINSNLVMYDRSTDSYFPQMLATGITGPYEAATLREFNVVWTSWERWREVHPETAVLSDETGFIRNYNNDPYGSYAPPSGHYSSSRLMFPAFVDDPEDVLHPKEVVIGSRTEAGAFAIRKGLFADHPVIDIELEGATYVAVYDEGLDTAYVYENPQGIDIEPADDGYAVEGEVVPADSLPLDAVVRFDAMWFAWIGYYPRTLLLH